MSLFAHLIIGNKGSDRSNENLDEKNDSLIKRLKAGDCNAADELVDNYYEQIYLFMRRLGHRRQVAEELVQETFLAAWQHIEQLRRAKAINCWLYRIASNVSSRYWRKNKNNKAVNIDEIYSIPDQNNNYEQLEDREQLNRLTNAIRLLPVKLRQAVVLHYMQHLTIAEAAEAAAVRQGTFKSRLHRALKALRKQMTEELGDI